MKKNLSLLLLLVLLLAPLQVLAQEERYEAVWSADYISTIDGTDLVKVEIYGKGEGLYTAAGEVKVAPLYGRLVVPNNDMPYYFEVLNSNSLNEHALIDDKDQTLIPYAYSDFEIISKEWVAAIILEPTTAEPYDYSSGLFGSGPDKYIIKWVDIYYMPGQTKVGSLTRDEYKRAKAWGDYLLVEDRSNNVQLYDKDFNKIQSAFDDYYKEAFLLDNSDRNQGFIRSRLTGETIGKGYSHVYELDNTDYLDVKGKRAGAGVIDRNGNIIVPLEYDWVHHAFDKYVVVECDEYYGLFDMEAKKLVVPCEYDEILYDYDNGFVFNGYIGVVKDGKIGYINLENQITCPIKYGKTAITNVGCVAYAAELDGYQLIAADGVVTALDHIAEIYEYGCSPSGYFLVAKNHEGLWGVIDWHGETVIDFHANYSSTFEFINDEYMIYSGDDDTVYRLKK